MKPHVSFHLKGCDGGEKKELISLNVRLFNLLHIYNFIFLKHNLTFGIIKIEMFLNEITEYLS